MKKRYMLFGFDTYYPCGGMTDFLFSFDTNEEFEKGINKEYRCDHYHIFDTVEGSQITSSYMKLHEIQEWIKKMIR